VIWSRETADTIGVIFDVTGYFERPAIGYREALS
jgi:hypothetical protein